MATPKNSTDSTTQPSAFIKRTLTTLRRPPVLSFGLFAFFLSLPFFPIGHFGAAHDDAYRAFRNGSLEVGAPGVLVNDIDPDGERLTANLLSAPNNGELTLSENGGFLYVPEVNFVGEDNFVYEAIDGGFFDAATVTITITPKPATLRTLDLTSAFGI